MQSLQAQRIHNAITIAIIIAIAIATESQN
jgi:hypothetical protein